MLGLLCPRRVHRVTSRCHRCERHVDAAGEWCALSSPLREVVAVLVVDGRTSGHLSLALLPRVAVRAAARAE
eukprot:7021013-Prymnesium_polylepis.1